MNGFIKLYRSLLEWEWYRNTNTKTLFIHMLLKANRKDGNFQGRKIEKGSFVSTVASLSNETGLSIQQVRTALENLKKTNEITTESTNKYTVFTVKNYCLYQKSNKQTNNQITDNQHPDNKQLTTIEEIKNKRNIYDGDDTCARAREIASSLVDKYWGRKATDADIGRVSTLIRDFKNRTVSEDKLQLLEYAFECSSNANAMNWNYIQGVLDKSRARGITTLAQAYEFDVKRDFGG